MRDDLSPTDTLLDSPAVSFEPRQPAVGEPVIIRYRGILAEAEQVRARLGYGKKNWSHISELPMKRSPVGEWEARHTISSPWGPLNVCFHDTRGNWDNNGGLDWQIEL